LVGINDLQVKNVPMNNKNSRTAPSSGANPTSASYNASVVNFYNAYSVLKAKFFKSILKNAKAYYNAGVVAVN
jgi:hypothetical protein